MLGSSLTVSAKDGQILLLNSFGMTVEVDEVYIGGKGEAASTTTRSLKKDGER